MVRCDFRPQTTAQDFATQNCATIKQPKSVCEAAAEPTLADFEPDAAQQPKMSSLELFTKTCTKAGLAPAQPTATEVNIFDILWDLEQLERENGIADREYNRQVAIGEERAERHAKRAEIATYRTVLSRVLSLLQTGAYVASGTTAFGGESWKSISGGLKVAGKAISGVKEIDSADTQGDRAEAQSLYAIHSELKRLVEEERRRAVSEIDRAWQRIDSLLSKLDQLASQILRG